jgi:hypothetical protein
MAKLKVYSVVLDDYENFQILLDLISIYCEMFSEEEILIESEKLEKFLFDYENELDELMEKYDLRSLDELISKNIINEKEWQVVENYVISTLNKIRNKRYDYVLFSLKQKLNKEKSYD